ncbi:RNA 3'-terminal phosphate cyclase domain-containing protein [Mycena amicta]|nr:RNA 3'-terminal phosphate cyclase domain-containing protein [Mycena amicta]
MHFIDGSVLEGGGQILRNSISLSALLRKPITISKVRNGRRPPGLKNQHRTGIELAAQICSAAVTGVKNGSESVEFIPGQIEPGDYTAVGSCLARFTRFKMCRIRKPPGASTLLLQIALPLLLFGSKTSTITLKGGTNATNAPQIDYIQHVFLPFATLELDLRRRGYFPKGGGEVHVTVHPTGTLKSVSLMERGTVTAIRGIAHIAGLPAHLGHTMKDAALNRLAQHGFTPDSVPIHIESKRENNDNTVGAGSGIVLYADLSGGGVIGGSAVGSKQKDAAAVGEEAADELIKGLEDGGVVDEYLQDQIIILMALASSESSSEIKCGKGELSLHTQTAIFVAAQMTDAKFDISVEQSGHTVIRCKGIGYFGA